MWVRVISIQDILAYIRWGADLTTEEFNELRDKSPEYLDGWLAHERAIVKEQDKMFEKLREDGVSIWKEIEGWVPEAANGPCTAKGTGKFVIPNGWRIEVNDEERCNKWYCNGTLAKTIHWDAVE